MRSVARQHASWLDLLETTGPFITLPVAKEAFPHGLEPTRKEAVAELRQHLLELHTDPNTRVGFIRFVLSDLLEHGAQLHDGPAVPLTLTYTDPRSALVARPDLVVVDPSTEVPAARLLVTVWPAGSSLFGRVAGEDWTASPVDRMAALLRSASVPVGLVTDGLRWTLVSVATGAATGTASWDADIWLEERSSLDAFTTLLGVRRFFGVAPDDRLDALLARSAEAQEEVTDRLGVQVRDAVSLLVDAFGRADRESGGRLLDGVEPDEVYAAAVAVMMRLVFLLYAEERHLFPIDDLLYSESYAASTLRAELEREMQAEGEGPLDLRFSAWSRLLASFRLIHDGVQHEDLHQPAYGGGLFDPERHPFLEGRRRGEPESARRPMRVSDLTVKYILDALQVLTFTIRGVREARRLSFRSLDVEQIGHVYEGLLDHGVLRVDSVHLGFAGKLEPEVALTDVETRAAQGREPLIGWLTQITGMTGKQVSKALDQGTDAITMQRLRAACEGDDALVERIRPFVGGCRLDPRGIPTVYLPGSFYVTKSRERRSAGAYYTPRSLAEEMVQHALEPLVYSPGPQDTDDQSQWKLKSVDDILSLKICDFTMGSGAFLVAASRFLADRLIEASGEGATADGEIPEEVVTSWRRRVIERCLYGVDRDPMAVEMAKLSLWLVTLSKDRPFTFLDGQLACGDALLGITSMDQIANFHLDPERGAEIHGPTLFGEHLAALRTTVIAATQLRDTMASIDVLTSRDAQHKEELLAEYQQAVQPVALVGDLLLGAALSTARRGGETLDTRLRAIAPDVDRALTEPDSSLRPFRLQDLASIAQGWLDEGCPDNAAARQPLHWPLAFPEVFATGQHFDAIIGNPPFLGGSRISGPLGSDYRAFLAEWLARRPTDRADLAAFFFLRAAEVSNGIALLATNTISQSDTRDIGLGVIVDSWTITRAVKSRPWPGEATLEVAQLWLRRHWGGRCHLIEKTGAGSWVDTPVKVIPPTLEAGGGEGVPHRLMDNAGLSFRGFLINGAGFVLTEEEASALLASNPKNADVLAPYLNGEDANNSPDSRAGRWVINFGDRTEQEARAYPDLFRIVEERVKPARDGLPDTKRMVREQWWLFEKRARQLVIATAHLDRVCAITRVSSVVQPVMVTTKQVISDALAVFPFDDYAHFALLCSAFHSWWAQTWASTLRADVRYSPTDCFETFPLPALSRDTEAVGSNLYSRRHRVMHDRQLGLTKTYNLVHDWDVHDADVNALREAHVMVDEEIRRCYGWDDLDLEHGFHDTPLGRRFAVSPGVRAEILRRLLALNHERAEDDATAATPEPKRRRRVRSQLEQADALPLLEATR